MNALLDEHLSDQIAKLLRERGLDVVAVVERPELAEASDAQVLDAATREQRTVVTNNIKDFRPLAAQCLIDGRGHGGLILLPSSRSRDATGALASAIERVMRAHPGGIANSEHWVPPF